MSKAFSDVKRAKHCNSRQLVVKTQVSKVISTGISCSLHTLIIIYSTAE